MDKVSTIQQPPAYGHADAILAERISDGPGAGDGEWQNVGRVTARIIDRARAAKRAKWIRDEFDD